ncbi:LuxR C-terminal-related transcriptional regulator [Brachybacterium saurashtrense]|uniref:LuxR C-terminal-related transcriptional regulator n=1 Tax=Brachybacterium saurashtrense TaxID=556288 RepID=UPI0013B43D34|nr:LuxR C-terminal-related transcriptional regulator [Brachybacterium saurashtrense]
MTVVIAPAGAGKSIGTIGWLRRDGREPDELWIHADSTWDCERFRALLDFAARADGPRRIVVDDAHRLPSESFRLLGERLTHHPDTLRMLLLSRWDLPLATLVPELLGHYSALRGDVLRTDDEETASLVRAHAPTAESSAVEVISTFAQGWCAPIVLTARVLGAAQVSTDAVHRYANANAGGVDQVVNEVFATLRPDERHLLLCTASEEILTPRAAIHLTRDPRAGDALDRLAATGLLVLRIGDAADSSSGNVGDESRYMVHPLLREVVRRRLLHGGVDVVRAQATVSRAVALDVSHGDGGRAFERLVAVNEIGRATELLGNEGLRMVMRGEGHAVADFVRCHPEEVHVDPRTWFAIALDRWMEDDLEAALGWMELIVQDGASNDPGSDDLASVCIGLMRARLGIGSPMEALDAAQKVLTRVDPGRQQLWPQLLTEMGSLQNWVGDLDGAEAHLTRAVECGQQRGLSQLAAEATSQLAITQMMAGREAAAHQLAVETLCILDTTHGGGSRFTRARAVMVRTLVQLWAAPGQVESSEPGGAAEEVPASDPCSRFWLRLCEARRSLVDGTPADAERILSTPLSAPVAQAQLPEHLQIVILVEHALLATLAADRDQLASLEARLAELGSSGEALFVRGLRHDLAGDRHAAAADFETASEEQFRAQPPGRALCLASRAQLLNAAGQEEQSLRMLSEALRITEARQIAVPFHGWIRQGTPMGHLLLRLRTLDGAAARNWLDALASSAAGTSDAVARFAPRTATPRERAVATTTVVRPALSPRERDVLNELARGATYADIAAALFVSENTVKTHVSSLYGKLAVSRRSDALAAARSMNLL